MTKMIQIRNVPDEVHRALKVGAAQLGTTLSDYLLREVSELVGRPTVEEVLARIRARGPAASLPITRYPHGPFMARAVEVLGH